MKCCKTTSMIYLKSIFDISRCYNIMFGWSRSYSRNERHDQSAKSHYKEEIKRWEIFFSDTLTNPRAMMIIVFNTNITVVAMIYRNIPNCMARSAKSRVLPMFWCWGRDGIRESWVRKSNPQIRIGKNDRHNRKNIKTDVSERIL